MTVEPNHPKDLRWNVKSSMRVILDAKTPGRSSPIALAMGEKESASEQASAPTRWLMGIHRTRPCIELSGAEQRKDQPYQLPGGECRGAFVGMFGRFLILSLVEPAVLLLGVHPQRVGRLTQVAGQKGVASLGQGTVPVLGAEVPRLAPWRPQPSVLDQGIVIREEADLANLG